MTTRTKRTLSKALSFLLALLMVIYVIPVSVFANDKTTDIPITESIEEYDEEKNETSSTEEEPYVLGEVESLRTETSKTFRLSNGNFAAVEYGQQKHYKDDSGKMQDYDNTLVFESSDDAKSEYNVNAENSEISSFAADISNRSGYKSVKSDISVKFSNNSKISPLYNIKTDKYSIGLNLIGAEKKIVSVKNNTKKAPAKEEKPTIDEAAALEKLSSSIKYEDILKNTDIEYILNGSNLKENIIVKAKNDSYVYMFALDLNGVVPQLNEDGSIFLLDENTREVAFTIPAGYMFDAKGEVSNSVEYSLEPKSEKSYTLIVTADASWINDDNRAFPVTIDPALTATAAGLLRVKDTYISEELPTANNGETAWMYSGYSKNSKTFNAVIGLYDLNDSISETSVIISAKLKIVQLTDLDRNSGGSLNLGIFKLDGTWTVNSMNWNYVHQTNSPVTVNAAALDYITVKSDEPNSTRGETFEFDITEAVQDWYKVKNGNYGLIIKPLNPPSASTFAGLGTANNEESNQPVFIIEYRDNKGLEDRWSFSEHSAGNAGTGYVNLFTGNLVFKHDDISTNGSILPTTVSHIYNSCIANNLFFETNDGKGWKLSIQERLKEVSIDGKNYICYNDADGTDNYFIAVNDTYVSEDGKGLYISRNTSSTEKRYKMTDDYNNAKYFDANGRLTYITDAWGNQKYFWYNGNKLTTINHIPAGSSSATEQIRLHYNTENALYLIENSQNSNEWVRFYYSYSNNGYASTNYSGYLRVIESSLSGRSEYEYDSNGVLIKATDKDTNLSVNYTYSSNKIDTVTEKSSAGNDGQTVGFTYADKKTVVQSSGNDDLYKYVDEQGICDDILTTYLFDNEGRTICVYSSNLDGSTIYGTNTAEYNSVPGSKKNNTISKDAVSGTPAVNYIKNSNAEGSFNYWTPSTPVGGHTASLSTEKYVGNNSFKISSINASGEAIFSQGVWIVTPGIYTLSAYVKTESISGSGGAYLRLTDAKNNKYISNKLKGTTSTDIQNGWQRIFVTTEFSVGQRSYQVELVLGDATGNVYFDCIQLEKGDAPSSFNFVSDGSFEVTGFWGTNYGGAYSSDPKAGTDGYNHYQVMKLEGSPSSSKYIYQNIPLNISDAKTFVLSGWATADSAYIYGDRTFLLAAVINYSDGTSETHLVKFNPCYSGWQFVSDAIVPNKQSSGLTITSIDLYCKYDYNINTAYFDNICLTLEPAQTYSYDENGNLLRITDDKGNKTFAEYATNGVDLTKHTSTLGEVYNFQYQNSTNPHAATQVTKTDADKTITANNTYDSYGNNNYNQVISSTTSGEMTSSRSYSNNGNYLSSSTDSRGLTTNYNYNTATGLLNYVVDANNNHANYSYDSRHRITDVYNDLYSFNNQADSNETRVHYSYSGNKLQHIISSANNSLRSTDYLFNYDEFSNVSSIQAGSYTLASYTYAQNNGKLTSTNYSNNFSTQNVYDSLDRVVGIKYNGIEKFKFTYNESGQLYKSTDGINNMVYTYEYDSLGRLIRAYVYTDPGNTLVVAIENKYDSYGRACALKYVFPESTQNYTLTYKDKSNLVSTMLLPTGATIYYSYDGFERLTSKSLSNTTHTYTYLNGSGSNTTALIASETITANGTGTTYSYTYDNVGNIKTVSENGVLKHTYTYDTLGQLTCDQVGTKSTYYNYDSAGNITSKVFCENGIDVDRISYSYGNATWKDLLTTINGTTINYDSIGNPLNWTNSSTLTWTGKELSTYHTTNSNVHTINFTYNADGIRTKKNVQYSMPGGDQAYYGREFVLDGKKIVKEIRTSSIDSSASNVYYFYDDKGSPIGFNYNNTNYSFGKNSQGDIVKVFNTSGVEVASYTYDAWGNVSTPENNSIADINPFRYRGYYYDTETGLYYCNARYYDPNVGRFISADSEISSGNDINGLNLFAYCGNNPVMRDDPDGTSWLHWVAAAAVVVVCAVAVVATAGGAAPAIAAVASVASGSVAATTSATVAASAFIGSSIGLAGEALYAASSSNTLQEFGQKGDMGTVATTLGGALSGVFEGRSRGRAVASSISDSSGSKKETQNPGVPFKQGQRMGSIQEGVDPNTLIPQKNLSSLDPQRIKNAVKFAGDKAIEVSRRGVIQQGHHRVADAIAKGRAVDVVITAW